MAVETDSSALEDGEAFGQFFVAHRDPVYRFCYCFVGKADVAEDLLGETFLRAYGHRNQLPTEEEAARRWLLRVAKNLAVDQHRRARRHQRLLTVLGRETAPRHRDPQNDVAERSALGAVVAGFAELSDRDRTLIALRVADGLSFAEIAAVTGRSVPAVQMGLQRARARLRRRCPVDWEELP